MLMKHLVRAEGQLVAHFEQKTDRVPTGKRRPKVALAKE
jgi:hypothetical protein